jgi:hypothetical protein
MTPIDLKLMDGEQEYKVISDNAGNPLEGGNNYKFIVPSNIPAGILWSVCVYDSQTKLLIRTDQLWPSVYSNCKGLEVNLDGSICTWFGPKVPEGKEFNWIQTLPGKRWYMIMHLYNPLENWMKKGWQPGQVEVMSDITIP